MTKSRLLAAALVAIALAWCAVQAWDGQSASQERPAGVGADSAASAARDPDVGAPAGIVSQGRGAAPAAGDPSDSGDERLRHNVERDANKAVARLQRRLTKFCDRPEFSAGVVESARVYAERMTSMYLVGGRAPLLKGTKQMLGTTLVHEFYSEVCAALAELSPPSPGCQRALNMCKDGQIREARGANHAH